MARHLLIFFLTDGNGSGEIAHSTMRRHIDSNMVEYTQISIEDEECVKNQNQRICGAPSA
ncbi:hypothetical protein KSX_55310 [Ktedonospora formicarum]|uniref:Uncharacterized protein n=1 Tax=Ktedonospora formicarum TaxID=2778364 RepID=A0A8J3MV72_9CHLR|nr:hypothetical protein KSX_55310 [Ktedonospora formicarum]